MSLTETYLSPKISSSRLLFFFLDLVFLTFLTVSDRKTTKTQLLEGTYSGDILEQQWNEHQKSHKKSYSYEASFRTDLQAPKIFQASYLNKCSRLWCGFSLLLLFQRLNQHSVLLLYLFFSFMGASPLRTQFLSHRQSRRLGASATINANMGLQPARNWTCLFLSSLKSSGHNNTNISQRTVQSYLTLLLGIAHFKTISLSWAGLQLTYAVSMIFFFFFMQKKVCCKWAVSQ